VTLCLVNILSYSPGGSTRREVGHMGVILDPRFGRGEGVIGSAMILISFERAMVFSYRLSVVTIAQSLTIRPQFTIECLRRLSQQKWVTFGQNLWRKGLSDVSQILTLSGRDMGLSYAKIVSISVAVWAQYTNVAERQTSKPRNGNIDTNRGNRFQRCRLKSWELSLSCVYEIKNKIK